MTRAEIMARAQARFGRTIGAAEVARLGRRLEAALAIAERIDGWIERLGSVDPATVSRLVHPAGNPDERA